MKTIVETATGLSKYIFQDAETVAATAGNIVVGKPERLIIADLNKGNATIHEGVTAPVDWMGNKYTFDGSKWAVNPQWVDITPKETPLG